MLQMQENPALKTSEVSQTSEVLHLFFRYSELYHSIHNPNGIGGDIHHRRHLQDFARPHIELCAMPWTGDGIAFETAFAHRAIIVGANIGDRKISSGDVEYYNRLTPHFKEHPLAAWQLTGRDNFNVFDF